MSCNTKYIYYYLYAIYKIIVDETQVPPEDMDETYVEGFTYDEASQDQGLLNINYDFTVKLSSCNCSCRYPATY